MADLKPGLYRLTKSLANPFYEVVSHRDLMGVIRAFPKGWDWLVHREDHPEAPFLVMAACGNWCQSMYVHEKDYKTAMEDWDKDGDPPLLAPPEFLEALEPREADTLTRLKQLHKFDGLRDYKFDAIIEYLIATGKLDPKDLREAMAYAVTNWDEMDEKGAARNQDEELYSTAVNEVFNETGEHWID